MKYLILLTLLSFQVNAIENADEYYAVGVCQVMIHQTSVEEVNKAIMEYWDKVIKLAKVNIIDYRAECVALVRTHFWYSTVKVDESWESGKL